MAFRSPFQPLDPRIKREFVAQKLTIRKGLTCTAITSLLYTAVIPLTTAATKAIGDIAVNAGKDSAAVDLARKQLSISLLLVFVLFAIRYFFTRGQIYYLSQAGVLMATNLRRRLFAKLMRLPISYFSSKRAGAIQSVVTNDINVFQTAISITRDSLDAPIRIVFALAWVFVLSWQLGLLALLVIPAMGTIIQRNAKKMRTAQLKVQEDLADVNATFQESLQGVRVVKAFAAENEVSGMYDKLLDQSYKSQLVAAKRVASLRPLVELMGAFALGLVLYGAGILAGMGRMNVHNIVGLALAMDMINQGFRALSTVGNTFASVQAAADRIYGEVLDVDVTQEAHGTATLPITQGKIEFRDVSFDYPDGTSALRNVNFTVNPGESLALVGPSGAGKSTIADLLLRFYEPTSGLITYDGVDTRELNVEWLRGQFGVVPQQTFLFAGTIEDNVRMGNPGVSDEDVQSALVAAHAQHFTKEMSTRTDDVLGERGVKLSGGQMQRVAIARALVRKPTVLLLDEATSALDAESERIVGEALEAMMHGRTTVFIAHRLTTAARATRILVLVRGEVIEMGSHVDLMSANGAYAGLFRAFAGGLLDS